LPLTESVSFKAVLQKGNRIQIPRLVRWQFKLEPTQILKIRVEPEGLYLDEEFLGRMNNDGRITTPKLIMNLLKEEEENLEGHVFKVMLTPP
jgi:hypothetical protein